MCLNVFYRCQFIAFNEIIWRSAVEATPPAVTAGALMWFLSTACFFFLFFHLQQAACCSLRSSRICCCISDPSFTFWAFCGRVSVSTSNKNKNVQSGCSELRTVPLRLARKQAASLLRSRAISATDDTLMDAMEEQHDSLASSCPQMCPRYCENG